MPLLDIWEKARDSVVSMSALQILTIAGDGALKDNSDSSYELREFLSYVSIDALEKYACECLNEKFSDGGFFLQDIVNELGRRLEHNVEPGLYRGVKGKIGFDGLWDSPEKHCLLVEVKSSTAYSIDLDRIAFYRSSLIDNGKIDKLSSVLIVVGSEDTSGLEAQIRGSRYAWDMRIISLEGLIKLVKIKDSTEEEITGKKIRSLLIPIEYTKLDGIIDVMFTTTTDIEETINTQDITVDGPLSKQEENDNSPSRVSRTSQDEIQAVKQSIIQLLERKFDTPLQAKSKALYLNSRPLKSH